jgi:RNA polymerase sigma-B factor
VSVVAQPRQVETGPPAHLSKTEKSPGSPSTEELLAEAKRSQPDVRSLLEAEAIETNMGLARGLAGRYVGRGIAADDLNQVAYMGLVKAVRRYDPSRGRPFVAFAVPTIRGEIRRHFRDAGWMVRPPRRLQELSSRIRGAEEELIQTLHRSPTPREIAQALRVDLDEVIEALSTDGCFTPSSLDAPGANQFGSVADQLGEMDPDLERSETRIALSAALQGLPERDRRIVELRFVQGLTQQEVGEQIGVSQMHISRLLSQILEKLRVALAPPESACAD